MSNGPMTTRRDFLWRAGLTSLLAQCRISKLMAAEPPHSPSPLLVDGQPEGSAGLFGDPYSAYATRLVDGTIGSDVAGGTTQSRTWNGVTKPFQIYKTLEFAIADYFVNAGVRIGLIAGQTYSPGTELSYPSVTSGKLGPSAQRILQGDPAAGPLSLPVIDGSRIVSGGSILAPARTVDGSYTTVRKVELRNGNNGTGIYVGGEGNADFVTIEYCHIHHTMNPARDNNGGIYSNGEHSNLLVQYCKIHDNTEAGRMMGGWGIESYFTRNATVRFCEFYNAGGGVFVKAPTRSGSGQGWTITNNVFRDMTMNNVQGGVYYGEQSAADAAYVNDVVAYNLFYNISAAAMYAAMPDKRTTNTGLSFYNNTIAQDCGDGLSLGPWIGTRFYNNISLAQRNHVATFAAWTGSSNFALIDYNAYRNGAWELNRYGTPNLRFSTLMGKGPSSWQAAHSNFSSPELATLAGTHNPDLNSIAIGSFVNSAVDANFNDPSARNYGLKSSSPLKGRALNGGDPGYDPNNCGPGW
jgi:Right handed beta helix region